MDLHTRFVVRQRQELNCLGFLLSTKAADTRHAKSRSPLLFGEVLTKCRKCQRSFRSTITDVKLLICSIAGVTDIPF